MQTHLSELKKADELKDFIKSSDISGDFILHLKWLIRNNKPFKTEQTAYIGELIHVHRIYVKPTDEYIIFDAFNYPLIDRMDKERRRIIKYNVGIIKRDGFNNGVKNLEEEYKVELFDNYDKAINYLAVLLWDIERKAGNNRPTLTEHNHIVDIEELLKKGEL